MCDNPSNAAIDISYDVCDISVKTQVFFFLFELGMNVVDCDLQEASGWSYFWQWNYSCDIFVFDSLIRHIITFV